MPMQRQTAKKVRIVDVVSGEWVKKEGMEPSYIITPLKENISRMKIAGTVVGKFTSEDGNFSSVTIDDSTATIRAKLWREIALLNDVNMGDIVSLIGKVREYEGEIYVVPEMIRKITPDEEALARLDILRGLKGQRQPQPRHAGGHLQQPPPEEPRPEESDLRKNILTVIEQNEDGIKYGDLIAQVGAPEEGMEAVINELLGEGVCYEPTPGKIKKI
ncbi:MAG: hypothetical protein JSV63_03615 [Candidatus Aenigmatarchaeota archaeon]|nr:MAG: hypothetical protein JSV63_03615 [Candidatus Aenigmarchaeota archaeon]